MDSTTFHVFVNSLSFRVPRVLYDFWNGTRFLFGKDLFPDKLKDFNGLALRATSFNFPPYTYQARPQVSSNDFNDKIFFKNFKFKSCNTWTPYKREDGSWGGWEYLIMETLASNLNFAMDIQHPPNGELWGENRNGTFTGEFIPCPVLQSSPVTWSEFQGLVGQLQKEESDIGWADLFLIPDRMKYIDYTSPYIVEYASFMLGSDHSQPLDGHQ